MNVLTRGATVVIAAAITAACSSTTGGAPVTPARHRFRAGIEPDDVGGRRATVGRGVR